MAYKVQSQKAQHALRRIINRHLGDYHVDDLDPEQVRENLVKRYQWLQQEIKRETNDSRKYFLGHEFYALNQEINKLRPTKKFGRDFANYLVDVIRQETPKYQWDLWVKKAEAARQSDNKELEEMIENLDEPTEKTVEDPQMEFPA